MSAFSPLSVARPIQKYSASGYFHTASGTKVSKRSVLCGSQRVHITGRSIIKDGVILRGDLAHLRLGKNVVIGEDCVIHPPTNKIKGVLQYITLSIGDYVVIGKNSVICATQIGSNVIIGEDCVIGKRCIIKNNSVILPGTVLSSDTNVPPYCAFGGTPGGFVGELPESTHLGNKNRAIEAYESFLASITPENTKTPPSPERAAAP
eukprot:Lankesteria_metandrocarpae@DN4380_c0_g1_i1.p1